MGYWKWLFNIIYDFFGFIKDIFKSKGNRVGLYGIIAYFILSAIAIVTEQPFLLILGGICMLLSFSYCVYYDHEGDRE